LVLVCITTGGIFLSTAFNQLQLAEARTEEIVDNTNNNLKISMVAPDYWNSGIVSQTISDLNWRLNGLDAVNSQANAIFAVANLPQLVNIALPLGQKTGIISLILSGYVTINKEHNITMTDGSSAHLYSISATPEQLRKVNIAIDEGLDVTLIITQQGDITYFVAYAAPLGRMPEFEGIFQNILSTVRFGSVGFSGSTATEVPASS